MKLSTRGRYAMVALCEIALSKSDDLTSLGEISRRQNISMNYLEQLFVKLRRQGLVESVRGPGGGYKLARPADQVRIFDVLSAVDESMNALEAGNGARGGVSGTRAQSLTNRLWEGLSAHVYVYLHQLTLADVVANGLVPCPALPSFMEDEVRPCALRAQPERPKNEFGFQPIFTPSVFVGIDKPD